MNGSKWTVCKARSNVVRGGRCHNFVYFYFLYIKSKKKIYQVSIFIEEAIFTMITTAIKMRLFFFLIRLNTWVQVCGSTPPPQLIKNNSFTLVTKKYKKRYDNKFHRTCCFFGNKHCWIFQSKGARSISYHC